MGVFQSIFENIELDTLINNQCHINILSYHVEFCCYHNLSNIFPHRLPRHIRRSHQTPVEQLNNHALLPSNSCHSSMNTLEFTFCHNYVITKFKLNVV